MKVVVRIEEQADTEKDGSKVIMSMTADHTVAAGALRAIADKWDPPKKVTRGD
jgi:hypothetical protein